MSRESKVLNFILKEKKFFFLLIFIFSFLTRTIITIGTPARNKHIDLCIYIDGGQLISYGVNPYNHADNIGLRNQLRTDSIAYNDFTCQTQLNWNTYASGNLPMNLIFFNFIDTFFGPDPVAYRLVFSFFDAILVTLTCIYILHRWKFNFNQNGKYLYSLAIICFIFSPQLFHWGTIHPEDKGVEIILILAALYFSESKSIFNRIFISSLFLGASIAFKGIGIFVFPLCIYNLLSQPKDLKVIFAKNSINNILLYTGLAGFFALIWFIPYIPHVFDMMVNRLSTNVSIYPVHGSIWRIFYSGFPNHWIMIKNTFTISFILLSLAGLFYKKLSFEIFTANLLLIFVVVSLQGGSMDRMQMAILISILLYGKDNTQSGLFLSLYYFIASLYVPLIIVDNRVNLINMGDAELYDSIFAGCYVVICLILSIISISRKTLKLANSQI